MRAYEILETGGRDVLQLAELPDPPVGPTDLLVRVRAAGVNRADILIREGKYPLPTRDNRILGLEAAGVVVGTGADVVGFQAWRSRIRTCARGRLCGSRFDGHVTGRTGPGGLGLAGCGGGNRGLLHRGRNALRNWSPASGRECARARGGKQRRNRRGPDGTCSGCTNLVHGGIRGKDPSRSRSLWRQGGSTIGWRTLSRS